MDRRFAIFLGTFLACAGVFADALAMRDEDTDRNARKLWGEKIKEALNRRCFSQVEVVTEWEPVKEGYRWTTNYFVARIGPAYLEDKLVYSSDYPDLYKSMLGRNSWDGKTADIDLRGPAMEEFLRCHGEVMFYEESFKGLFSVTPKRVIIRNGLYVVIYDQEKFTGHRNEFVGAEPFSDFGEIFKDLRARGDF